MYHKGQEYTWGFRRGNKLKDDTSTPNSVGPGRYVPESCALPSHKHNFARWTLPKAGRAIGTNQNPKNNRNQTFDTRSGFGV